MRNGIEKSVKVTSGVIRDAELHYLQSLLVGMEEISKQSRSCIRVRVRVFTGTRIDVEGFFDRIVRGVLFV